VAGIAYSVGTRTARVRLVETGAASGAVPAGLSVVMWAVCTGGTLAALGVAAAGATADHTPAWTASAAVRALPMMPDVRPAVARLESQRGGRWLVQWHDAIRDADRHGTGGPVFRNPRDRILDRGDSR